MSFRPPATGALVDGKYRLAERIGGGGMGEVFRAHNVLAGRGVAIKFLHPELAENDELAQRFFQEAQAVNRIRHPNIVDVIDAGMSESGPYLVMEHLEGESVSVVLARLARFDLAATVGTLIPVLEALDAAHRAGIVHRDLKPENVFIARSSKGLAQVRLLDFGIAKVLADDSPSPRTRTGIVFGTPDYLSPEQATGETPLDGRSDLFAVGVLLYEMITGVRPFRAPTAVATAFKVVHGDAPTIGAAGVGVDRRVEATVARLLEKDPQRRFQTAAEVVHELEVLVPDPYARSAAVARLVGLSPPPRTSRPPARASARPADLTVAETVRAFPPPLPDVLPEHGHVLAEPAAEGLPPEGGAAREAGRSMPPPEDRLPTLSSRAERGRSTGVPEPASATPEAWPRQTPTAIDPPLRREGSLRPSTPSRGTLPAPAGFAGARNSETPSRGSAPSSLPPRNAGSPSMTPGRGSAPPPGRASRSSTPGRGSADAGSRTPSRLEGSSLLRPFPVRFAGRYQVRGPVLRAVDRALVEAHGRGTRDAIVQHVPARWAADFRDDSINALLSYDLEALDAYLEIATNLGVREVKSWRDLGRRAVDGELAAFVRPATRASTDLHLAVRRGVSSWSRLFGFGEWRVEEQASRRTALHLTGFDPASLALRLWLVGVVEATLSRAMGRQVRATITLGEMGFTPELACELTCP
jgi:serine/threonine-protein kinase